MKKEVKGAVLCLGLILTIWIGNSVYTEYCKNVNWEYQTQTSLEYLRSGRFGEAKSLLGAMLSEQEDAEIRQYYLYAELMDEYEKRDIEWKYARIKTINLDESCDFYSDFQKVKNDVLEEYALYQEERARIEAETEKALLKSLATRIPYEGMSEKYIDSTACGTHDEYKSKKRSVNRKTVYEHKYIWYADNGADIPLIVICEEGEVKSVTRYYLDMYWTSDGMPNFSAERKSGSSGLGKENRNDPYDVHDYDDPDDFANEWAEEFGDGDFEDGWDDAWDYWQDYH